MWSEAQRKEHATGEQVPGFCGRCRCICLSVGDVRLLWGKLRWTTLCLFQTSRNHSEKLAQAHPSRRMCHYCSWCQLGRAFGFETLRKDWTASQNWDSHAVNILHPRSPATLQHLLILTTCCGVDFYCFVFTRINSLKNRWLMLEKQFCFV